MLIDIVKSLITNSVLTLITFLKTLLKRVCLSKHTASYARMIVVLRWNDASVVPIALVTLMDSIPL